MEDIKQTESQLSPLAALKTKLRLEQPPITPAMHGLVDYLFAAALFGVPSLVGCNKKTVQLYRGLALEVFLYGAMTRQPLALLPMIPMKVHKLIDVANLSGLSLLTGYRGIRKNAKAVALIWEW